MYIIRYPERGKWKDIVKRPPIDTAQLESTVRGILDNIRTNGDKAVIEYERKFGCAAIDSLAVTDEERERAMTLISGELLDALRLAHANIERFHMAQATVAHKVETCPGVTCWQKSVPIEKVGLYIPGGTAPLFSTVLMLATPAAIAGCRETVMCTPPRHDGSIHPAILAAANIAGVKKIFKTGGVQAIGAMAYGTESIPKVYKIFGPGNRYVMAAKQEVGRHDVAIDMPAGPSEVCVVADGKCNPEFVAADMLSQAEHGADSQAMLITDSEQVIADVEACIKRLTATLDRGEFIAKSLESSRLVLVNNLDEAMELSNLYAPEHLIIATENYNDLAGKVINAGSVFLGRYACESAGDYASGTNHTLPTHGHATAYSGVNLDSYNRKITFQHITPEGISSIGHAVEIMAENEQLTAHRNAMAVRREECEKIKKVQI